MVEIKITAHTIEAENALRKFVADKLSMRQKLASATLGIAEKRVVVSVQPLTVVCLLNLKGLAARALSREEDFENWKKGNDEVVTKFMRSRGAEPGSYTVEVSR